MSHKGKTWYAGFKMREAAPLEPGQKPQPPQWEQITTWDLDRVKIFAKLRKMMRADVDRRDGKRGEYAVHNKVFLEGAIVETEDTPTLRGLPGKLLNINIEIELLNEVLMDRGWLPAEGFERSFFKGDKILEDREAWKEEGLDTSKLLDAIKDANQALPQKVRA